jgi:hypothetical protein
MKGHLRIRADRTPYRRAGLFWPEGERQLEVPLQQLTGERLLTLVQDQALRVEAWHEGRYRPLGDLAIDLSASALQAAIELYGGDVDFGEDIEVVASPAEQHFAEQLTRADATIADQRVEIANLRTANAEIAERAGGYEARITQLAAESDRLREEVSAEREAAIAARARVAELEARIAELEAPAQPAPKRQRSS